MPVKYWESSAALDLYGSGAPDSQRTVGVPLTLDTIGLDMYLKIRCIAWGGSVNQSAVARLLRISYSLDGAADVYLWKGGQVGGSAETGANELVDVSWTEIPSSQGTHYRGSLPTGTGGIIFQSDKRITGVAEAQHTLEVRITHGTSNAVAFTGGIRYIYIEAGQVAGVAAVQS